MQMIGGFGKKKRVLLLQIYSSQLFIHALLFEKAFGVVVDTPESTSWVLWCGC